MCRVAVCGGDHTPRVGTVMVMDCRQAQDGQAGPWCLRSSGTSGVCVRDRDEVKGRNEAGFEWAELCPVVKFRSVCLSGILL